MTAGASRPPVPVAPPGAVSGAVPAEVAAWLAAGRTALAVAGRADEWSAVERQAVLAELTRVERLTAMLRGLVLTAERHAGTWGLHGDRDMAGFVGRQSREGRGAGMVAVAQAATLEALPVVAGALVDGPVTTRHLAEITRATAASPALAAEVATLEGQAKVVELAARLDGAEFGKVLQQEAAALDPSSRQREHDEQRANRSFAFTHTRAGTVFRGRLDVVAGHKLAKAIGALCPRPSVDDERSREQRQADALMVMVEHTLSDRLTTPGAVAPVQAIVTFDQATWVALRAAQAGGRGAMGDAAVAGGTGDSSAGVGGTGRPGEGSTADGRPGEGSTADVLGRLAGVSAVVDETRKPWPASEIARALCDCVLTRAVIGARGEVLDVGRGERLFQRKHWIALYAAGVRTCQMPGCGMPLACCELHHIRWWDRNGGRTDLANCAAYCSFHHHEIHRRDLRVTRRPDGSLEHRHPDGRPYGAAPAGDPGASIGGTAVPGVQVPVGRIGASADRAGPLSGTGSGSTDAGPLPAAGGQSTPRVAGPFDTPPDDLLALLTG